MKNTKFIVLIYFLLFAWSATAQQRPEDDKNDGKRDAIKKEKIDFIKENLKLSNEEFKAFLVVYNEFDGKRSKLFDNEHQLLDKMKKDGDIMSDKELTETLDKVMDLRVAQNKLQKEYHERLKKVISIRKVSRLYQLDWEFQKRLLKNVRKNQKD